MSSKRNSETAPRFAGIGGHHSKSSGTDEWATPDEIVERTGPYELDPCAPLEYPRQLAARRYTMFDNGLMMPWTDPETGEKLRVLLNPPYSEIEPWLARMALHDYGTALIFARTETEAFQRYVFDCASALLFMRGRINFNVIEPFSIIKTRKAYYAGDRAKGNSGAPTVLCAYGLEDADILATCGIEGRFVALRIPRVHFISWFNKSTEKMKSWREEIAAFFEQREGPVELDELYRHFASHRKAARNRNVDAKVRQQLQKGPYRRVAPGLWEAAR